jgi:NCAIR mutase (PurE)-related protein
MRWQSPPSSLLAERDRLLAARVVIVVAGMEAPCPAWSAVSSALPSWRTTGVGYGANLGGLTPLLAMLNSCATGIAVVNIDNGFGAAIGSAINHLS